jgi:WD40 repeat protein
MTRPSRSTDVREYCSRSSSSSSSVAFSVDSRIVSGSGDKTVKIWNAATGEVENTLQGHSSYVTSVAFSVDGSRIVSGSYDKTVKIWNAATGEVENTLLGHSSYVTSVAFSVDGSRIVSGSG